MLHPQTLPLLLIALVVALIGAIGFRLPFYDAGAALLALLIAALLWRAQKGH